MEGSAAAPGPVKGVQQPPGQSARAPPRRTYRPPSPLSWRLDFKPSQNACSGAGWASGRPSYGPWPEGGRQSPTWGHCCSLQPVRACSSDVLTLLGHRSRRLLQGEPQARPSPPRRPRPSRPWRSERASPPNTPVAYLRRYSTAFQRRKWLKGPAAPGFGTPTRRETGEGVRTYSCLDYTAADHWCSSSSGGPGCHAMHGWR